MLGWIENDHEGRSFFVREGTGLVSAVVPVGMRAEDGRFPFHRIEIAIDPIPGRGRAIKLSTAAQVLDGDAKHLEARNCEMSHCRIKWAIAWHRHSWVPEAIDISLLDLRNDAQAWLTYIEEFQIDRVSGISHEKSFNGPWNSHG